MPTINPLFRASQMDIYILILRAPPEPLGQQRPIDIVCLSATSAEIYYITTCDGSLRYAVLNATHITYTQSYTVILHIPRVPASSY